jgi:hypothetical protein
MSACTQCGTPARHTDRFCNACGTPIARTHAPPEPPGGPPVAPPYATPPPYFAPVAPGSPPGHGAGPGRPTLPRCQVGHEIAPGANYCTQGHPIALDQMQFASDAYANVPPAPTAYASVPPGPTAYATPPPPPPPTHGFGMGPGPDPGFGPPPVHHGFGGPVPGAPGYLPADTAREPAPPNALRGFLIAFGTNPSGDFWPLTGGRLVVGRLGAAADRIDISLQDPTISSRHAAMVVDAASGLVTLEDTGSTNGTFVNDEHIGFSGKRDLRDGDRVRFGAYTTIVKLLGRV